MTYDNTNSGALFKNDKRRDDDDPAYRGTINVNAEFYLSAWLKTSKAGAKYMSLSVKPKPEAVPTRKTAMGNSRNDMNDEIGF